MSKLFKTGCAEHNTIVPNDGTYPCWFCKNEALQTAITAALGEIKRSRGTPRLALIGVERILTNAVEVNK